MREWAPLRSENSLKAGKTQKMLIKAVSDLLAEADRRTDPNHIPQAYWSGKPIELTRGQIKVLQEKNCRLYFQDKGGWYYHIVDENWVILKKYKWS